ncbi:MAG TPA: TIGR02530 family flagellar biosynthesis protein [Bacillota bacterium]|jgi:flagellar operon protein|nr:TIGR02530 family flagellar biosynthesis protein [Bacillota bacterium]HOK71749.1 TIGR02530 family flagellar biosynthesis protein [Bacillota bacterium]HOL52084.1 TIGR02530 family flagellar biosynthesis protein [Bacillota bacterium]HOO30830.1 TIGR02530 family flagellar biosynthesis protein [Bacillota bacterium]HPZ13867.1 TIGR02530 family flagellar biosynthesis protein [Bacillota bacterium]
MTVDRTDMIAGRGMTPGISGVRPDRPAPAGTEVPLARGAGATFQDVLAEQLSPGGVKFSAHARSRLAARRIDLGQEDLSRLEGGVSRAAAKGARESLILLDDKAFVVSVRNRTVITAVDGEHLKENVFTNIDSAVIV